MLTRYHILPLSLLLLTLSSCNSNHIPSYYWSALQSAEKYELLSLNPSRETPKSTNTFHNFEILGRLEIIDPTLRKSLSDALLKSVQESDGFAALCFNPRHGIRLTQGSTTTDFLICFECRSMQIYVDGTFKKSILLTPSAQPTFDDPLTTAHIPLAPK